MLRLMSASVYTLAEINQWPTDMLLQPITGDNQSGEPGRAFKDVISMVESDRLQGQIRYRLRPQISTPDQPN